MGDPLFRQFAELYRTLTDDEMNRVVDIADNIPDEWKGVDAELPRPMPPLNNAMITSLINACKTVITERSD